MNQKRAKRMRRALRTVGYGLRTRYDEIRFEREYSYRRIMPDGTVKTVLGKYPVRTLFLVKCERAVYQRLKKQSKAFQNDLIKDLLDAKALLLAHGNPSLSMVL